jgi:hypothetical protein
MTGVYLTARALHASSWRALAAAPFHDWQHAWYLAQHGHVLAAFVLCAPVAVPAALCAAGTAWAWRIYAIETGITGRTATAPVVFDARQWRRQARTARARITAPGTVPLTDAHGRVVMGATIRTIGHRWHPVTAIPHTAMNRHQVVIGASGSGKTNLMMRTWAGWYAAARHAHLAGGGARPLLLVLDCKGGRDSRAKATRTRRLLHATGAGRVAVWPDVATISLWDLPPRDLAVTLFQMIDTGHGDAAYYADVTQAVLTLAVTAPPGPPASGTDFLARLDATWLESAYTGDPPRLSAVRAARAQLPDIALRYRTLLSRLGPALDGPGILADADAWYFILEGTREPSVAEAQAMALVELAAALATSRDTQPRPSCSPATTTRPCPARYRCGSSTNAAGPSGSACRSPRSPGKDSGPMRMSGTGSPPPLTAGSGCCAPPTPSPCASWPAPGGWWRPRPRSSAACGATKGPPGSSTPGR